MTYGTFEISREELVEQLSSGNFLLSASIPIFYDDQLDQPVGYTDETFNAENNLVCHVEESVFEKCCQENAEYRFGYKLNIDSDGLRQIELTSVNIVPKDSA